MKLLIAGGAGFIGSNFIRHMLETYPDYQILNLDLLTYAGNLENLADVADKEYYRFVRGDISDSALLDRLLTDRYDAVVNFAAESHVDRSIEDPGQFLKTNVLGTQALLEAACRHKISRFLQISTQALAHIADSVHSAEIVHQVDKVSHVLYRRGRDFRLVVEAYALYDRQR